jgi:hypothetical protein
MCLDQVEDYLILNIGFVFYCIILSYVRVTVDGVWIGVCVIEHLYIRLVTKSNTNSLTGLHTLKITVTAAHIKSSMSSPGNGC